MWLLTLWLAWGRPPDLVLISMDTTRADALSCYGRPTDVIREIPPTTPHLDRLAGEGLRFERFYAHAPTTLSSHTSMFTGLDPHEHGVPRNGFTLLPGTRTLAERLADAGYDTVGVVGASALSGTTGVGRGFRVWDDQLGAVQARQFEDPADRVVDRALGHLAATERDRPLFLFVHFFDAHAPYRAPDTWRERYRNPAYQGAFSMDFHRRRLLPLLRRGQADPRDLDQVASEYLAEVAFIDSQIGRLLQALRDGGRLDRALVVVTADHGETLSETPDHAWSHGYAVDDGAMRVPLILRGYGVPLGGPGVVRRQAGMLSLAPSIELLLGLPRTLGRGPDLADLVRTGPVWDEDGWPRRPTHTVFHEATQPGHREHKEGWNNLMYRRAVRAGGAVAVRALHTSSGVRMSQGGGGWLPLLTRLLRAWDAAAPAFRSATLDDATKRALQALGYLPEEQPEE